MNVKLIAALVAGALSTAPAFSTTLDFEGLTDVNLVGTPVAGISFGDDAIVVTNTIDNTYFTNGTGSSAFTSVGPSAFVNVAAGFTGTVSFNYAALADSTFNVYSDLNGAGNVVGTFSLTANNPAYDAVNPQPLSVWSFASIVLNGNGRSIDFGAAANTAQFDNLSLDTPAPVPLPGAAWLMVSALGGLGSLARRKRAA